MKTLTTKMVMDVFRRPMENLFYRWLDEHAYEAEDFKRFFQPLAKKVGMRVVRVGGGSRALTLTLKGDPYSATLKLTETRFVGQLFRRHAA